MRVRERECSSRADELSRKQIDGFYRPRGLPRGKTAKSPTAGGKVNQTNDVTASRKNLRRAIYRPRASERRALNFYHPPVFLGSIAENKTERGITADGWESEGRTIRKRRGCIARKGLAAEEFISGETRSLENVLESVKSGDCTIDAPCIPALRPFSHAPLDGNRVPVLVFRKYTLMNTSTNVSLCEYIYRTRGGI